MVHFPEIQISDALLCNPDALVFDEISYFPFPGISNGCTVTLDGKPLDCYFNMDTGKLRLILDAITGAEVWKI